MFDFIRAHGLLPQLPSRVPQLLRIDATQAIHLLVEEREAVSPSAVVPAIQVGAAHQILDYCQSITRHAPHAPARGCKLYSMKNCKVYPEVPQILTVLLVLSALLPHLNALVKWISHAIQLLVEDWNAMSRLAVVP